jgi:hypothetical protein
MHVLIPCLEQCQHDGSAKLREDGKNAGFIDSSFTSCVVTGARYEFLTAVA